MLSHPWCEILHMIRNKSLIEYNFFQQINTNLNLIQISDLWIQFSNVTRFDC